MKTKAKKYLSICYYHAQYNLIENLIDFVESLSRVVNKINE